MVTHESASCVGKCLASLAKHLPSAEVIVVDNASTDASVQVARAAGARVVELPRNVGFGRGCNAGVETASGEHVLFINPDVTLVFVAHDELDDLLARRPFGLAAVTILDATGGTG